MTILSDSFVEQYKTQVPNWGFNGLGGIVYKRTYARRIDGPVDTYTDQATGKLVTNATTRTEEWYETIRRCIEGAQAIGASYTVEEAEKLFDYVFNLKGSFGGRMLWQLGTPTVEKFGAQSLLNCQFIAIRNPRDFEILFENLMLNILGTL